MREWLAVALRPVLGVALVALALWVLHRELAQYHLGDVLAHLNAIPRDRVALSLALTALGYLALTGYDWLAFRYRILSSFGVAPAQIARVGSRCPSCSRESPR